MNTERWAQIERLFHEALEQPAPSRLEWLSKSCGDDRELLDEVRLMLESDAHGAATMVESGIRDAVMMLDKQEQLPSQTRVGPYSILREIGRGGMGRVYLAQRDDGQYDAQVALKVVRPGMDSHTLLSRFRQERQTLARLQHPNIARLLDGGTTSDGLPYFVMEYIDGLPVTEHCRKSGLDMEARLRLFLGVCAGVDYAHLSFVVHRDIKPGNILIDGRGTPKILDFGICKLLDDSGDTAQTSEARTRAFEMMTPDYASPEQVRGEAITVGSDVYSLGAVLYELLTGVKPHRWEKHNPAEIERAICERDILRPSLAAQDRRIARQLAGDLDNILLKALHKEPGRRYSSAARLADDLRRYLDHLPVDARPDSARYRLSKFLQRHRVGVAATTAVVAALTIGMIVSLREARRAEASLRQARHLANTFVVDVQEAISALPGATKARQMVAQKAAEQLDQLAKLGAGSLELDRELALAYQRVGDVQGNVLASNLGHTEAARQSYFKALSLLEGVLRRKPGDHAAGAALLEVYLRLGDISVYTKGTQPAQQVYEKGLTLGEALLKRAPKDAMLRGRVADLAIGAGRAQRLADQHLPSLASNKRAYGLAKELADEQPADKQRRARLANAASALGMIQVRMGNPKEALEVYQQAVGVVEALHKDDPSNVVHMRELMLAYSHVGDVYGGPATKNPVNRAGSREAYGKMADVAKQLHEVDPNDQRALADYGIALMRFASTVETPAAKVEVYQKSQSLLDRALAANPNNQMVAVNLAFVLEQMGNQYEELKAEAEAVRRWKLSLRWCEKLMDSRQTTPPRVAVGLFRKLGEHAARTGHRAEALDYAARALHLGEQSAKESEGEETVGRRDILARAYDANGHIRMALGHKGEARGWFDKSIALWAELKARKGFTPSMTEEMRRSERALVALR
ncbi:MAG: protein kinase [Acidobacteria bacterium]|nr:protein kinase [Acidobacteriota bacterium]